MNKARIAGAVYVLVFVTGGLALGVRGGVGSAAGLIAGLLYVAVTLLLSLANSLSPYNFVPGLIGEGALTVWLLVFGVNVSEREERADAEATSA